MANFLQIPSGDTDRDIRALFDWVRNISKTAGVNDLDTVCKRGGQTTESVEIGESITIRSGTDIAVLSIDKVTGRLQVIVNGRKQQSW